MLRYFFNVPDYVDEVGIVLPDDQAVRRYAMRYASDLLRDMEIEARTQKYWRMDVRREDGPVALSLVVELLPGVRSPSALLHATDEKQADGQDASFKRYGS